MACRLYTNRKCKAVLNVCRLAYILGFLHVVELNIINLCFPVKFEINVVLRRLEWCAVIVHWLAVLYGECKWCFYQNSSLVLMIRVRRELIINYRESFH